MAAGSSPCDCEVRVSEARTEPAMSDLAEARIVIGGMHCDACARRVQDAVAGLGGVESARVSLAPPGARVLYRPGEITTGALCAAIARAGWGTAHTYRAGTLL